MWNNAVDNTRNPEEELKKKIKSLKKRINNSNNHLEKKNLQQELFIAQKELKKYENEKKINEQIYQFYIAKAMLFYGDYQLINAKTTQHKIDNRNELSV